MAAVTLFTSLVDRVLSRWTEDGVTGQPPCSDDYIRAFEADQHVVLPDDLRHFYLTVNGMKIGPLDGMDRNGFAIYPLEMLVQASLEEGARLDKLLLSDLPDYYVFADYMTWSWAYGINMGRRFNGRIILLGTADGKVPEVAKSFQEFLDLYLRDAPNLYPPP